MVERIQGHRIDDQRFDMATFLRVRFNSFQSSRYSVSPLTRWSINLITCVSFILTSLTPVLLLLFLSCYSSSRSQGALVFPPSSPFSRLNHSCLLVLFPWACPLVALAVTLVHFCSRFCSFSNLFLVSSLSLWQPCTCIISPSFPFPSCLLVFVSSCLLLTLLSGKSSFCLWVLVPTLHFVSSCLLDTLVFSFFPLILSSCLLDTFVLLLSHLLYPFPLVYVSSCLLDTLALHLLYLFLDTFVLLLSYLLYPFPLVFVVLLSPWHLCALIISSALSLSSCTLCFYVTSSP